MAEIDVEPPDGSEKVVSEPGDEPSGTEPTGELQTEPAADGEPSTDKRPDSSDGGDPEPLPEKGPEADCSEGATQTCYSGAAATLGVGACKEGTQTCSGGKWGKCEGEVLPAQSDTCGNSVDDNCDGAVDEGCPCNYLGKAQGVCTNATNDAAGMCQAPPDYSDTEDCNDTLDNNCDGNANEGCACTGQQTRACGSDIGECQKGTQQCNNGNWSSLCKGEKKPAATDTCGDNKDNDCDGVIDENCPCHYKGHNKGVCLTAKKDAAGVCQPPAGYKDQELCGDSLDNNCDGKIDEFCPCFYLGRNQGVCATARKDSSGVCQKPSRYDTTERCDGVDNDCDGATDEGCPCNYLNKSAGVCLNSRRNAKGECIKPSTYDPGELCDGLDNNCDGRVDIFPSNATCLSYAHKCSIGGVSPAGPRDICIRQRPYCAGTTKKCNPSYFNTCESYRNAVKCQNDADCTKCNAEVGGAKFSCAKNLCMRTSQ